jgi:adenosylcobyric acid synthase
MARGRPPALMLQGTGSDVGKSLLVAGLCRALTRRGLRVRPFKPQNMSNNAAVTTDGGEIGRAQALQARACGVAASVHMNPVLLKPQTDVGAQVVVQGKVLRNAAARDYAALKPTLMPAVLDSFERLGRDADIVLVEGAGSPAEVNLRSGDIANMGFAVAADAPVVLVADIDRGGVIASLVGTHAVLPDGECARVAGFLINKFRGDASLFDDGLRIIEERTGWPSFGVVPFFPGARVLPKEDAVALDAPPERKTGAAVVIAVPRLSRIANFDDLDPLSAEPGVAVDLVDPDRPLPLDADMVLIPGSKATRADLDDLRANGWDVDIRALARSGAVIVGICGGYQMLGTVVSDPEGVEGPAGRTEGLGLLNVETVLGGDKVLVEASGREAGSDIPVHGYEMHIGRTRGADAARPWLRFPGGDHDGGAVDATGRVMGCYVHGLFASDAFRRAFLARLRAGTFEQEAWDARVERALDGLADHLDAHTDVDALLNAAG